MLLSLFECQSSFDCHFAIADVEVTNDFVHDVSPFALYVPTVPRAGIEPAAHALEERCSIH